MVDTQLGKIVYIQTQFSLHELTCTCDHCTGVPSFTVMAAQSDCAGKMVLVADLLNSIDITLQTSKIIC